MPELNLLEKAAPDAIIAYGNKSLRDDSPVGGPYIGAGPLSKELQTVRRFSYWITPAVDEEERKASVSDWPENEDPFTQTDLLNKEENQVQDLIFQIRKSLSIPYHESLAKRLLTLFNDAKEEDPASLGIAVGSLRNFYNFLKLNNNLKCPTISLTPDYNIYASWRGKQNRVFSVHFLPNADARFVIFKPNDKHPERQIRLAGIATTDVLMETVVSEAITDWVSE